MRLSESEFVKYKCRAFDQIDALRRLLGVFLSMVIAVSAFADSIDKRIELANEFIEKDPDSAVRQCDSINEERLSVAQRAKLYHTLGNAYFALGNNESAKDAFHRSIAYGRKANDTLTWASVLSDLGICYRITEKPDSALMMYKQSLALLEKIDAPSETSYLLTSIAVFYANQGRFDEAVKYGTRAFDLAKRCGDIETIMYAGQTLGIVLYLRGDKREGLAIEREMVAISEKRGLPRYILKTYASIIDMHYKDGRRDSVDYYISRGQKLMSQVPEASVESMGFLEESYVVLSAMGRYRESLEIQNKILSMRGAGTFMPFHKLYQRMARNYKGLGDIERMGEAYERSIAIADSLHGLEIDNQLSEFDVKYDTAQRELQIARLETEKMRQRMWMAITCVGAFLIILGLIIYFRSRRSRLRRSLEMQSLRSQLEAVDNERARLAAELHDGVCSDLSGIALMMQSSRTDRDEIVGMIDNVRTEVRSISHSLMPPRLEGLTLKQLLQDLSLRNDGKIQIGEEDFNVEPDVSFQLYRIAQEWVDNINRHSHASRIIVRMHDRSFMILDNGEEIRFEKSGGIGIDSITKRVESIGAAMAVRRENGENILKITLPD